MAATSIVSSFAARLGALADAVRSKAFTSASMTISEMTSAVLAMDAGDGLKTVLERGQMELAARAESIGSYALYRHYGLTAASFPNASKVDDYAFYSCTTLSRASLPTCTSIGSSAFQGCETLESVDMPSLATIGSMAFYGCTHLLEASFPNVTTMGMSAFQNCTRLSDASLPAVANVASSAFQGCTTLKRANVGKAANVYLSAFDNCQMLEEVDAGGAVYIHSYAFSRCYEMSHVRFCNLSSIYYSAFWNCSRLMSLDMAGVSKVPTLQYDMNNVFYNTPIYNNSTYTGAYGSIYVPSSLYSSFKAANYWSAASSRFVSCFAVPGQVQDAFWPTVSITGGVGVEMDAFDVSSGVASFAVKVNEAGYEGFNVVLSGLVPYSQYLLTFGAKFSSASFQAAGSWRVGYRLEQGSTTNYSSSTAWADNIPRDNDGHAYSRPFFPTTSTMHLAFNLTGLSSASNVVMNVTNLRVRAATWSTASVAEEVYDGYDSTWSVPSAPAESVTYDANLVLNGTTVGDYAYSGHAEIQTVTASACTTVGDRAFDSCTSLSEVTMPNCTSIGEYAFRNCKSLASVSMPSLSSVGYAAFIGCSALHSIYLPACREIGDYAFEGCYTLSEASFPSLEAIHYAAFLTCQSLMSLNLVGVPSVVALVDDTSGGFAELGDTPIHNSAFTGSFGSIYVSASLYSSFMAASQWSQFTSRIVSVA